MFHQSHEGSGALALAVGVKKTGLDIRKVGLATAFSSSFAHCILIGRPGLVIACTLGRNPETGERLLNLAQLFKYGFGLVIISWLLLWGWTFFEYWKFLSL